MLFLYSKRYTYGYAIFRVMIVVTSREFRDNQKKFLDLAKVERVIIKQRNQFLEIVHRGETIPENPSPSNDSYFDNPQNIEAILKASEQIKEGQSVKLTPELHEKLFGDL